MPDKPILITCPNPVCGKLSAGRPNQMGHTVKCTFCRTRFVVQATTETQQATQSQRSEVSRITVATPEAIGRFTIRSRLGAGAFGTVFRAYDPHLDRDVALKIPNAEVLANPRRVERFLREAKAAANLRHPHIIPVFDAGQDGERYFIASAFIDGRPLAEAVEETGLDFQRAARLTRELAEALAYAHSQGIVHRDVKPANIMLDAQDQVHLMDFGLAARQDEEAKLTNDGAVMGTPSYMAPEQAAVRLTLRQRWINMRWGSCCMNC
jgi:serine/threonine protein kinase